MANDVLRAQGLASMLKAVYNECDRLVFIHLTQRADSRLLQEHLGKCRAVICSTVQWEFPFKQRPQHLARAFGRLNQPCIYLAPRPGVERIAPGTEVATGVFLYYTRAEVISRLGPGHMLIVLSTDNSLDAELVQQAMRQGVTVIYDYIDVIDSLISQHAISKEKLTLHNALLADETVYCVASADHLHAEIASQRDNNYALITNGVDADTFITAQRGSVVPAEMAPLVRQDKPIVGYYGALASWLDYQLIQDTARLREDVNFILIGPEYDRSTHGWMSRFHRNIHLVPPVDYGEIAGLAVWFDVCMIPFRRSAITDATSPLKLFEYFALGKPVVATSLVELNKYAPVIAVGNAEQFADAITVALELTKTPEYIAECRRIALENTWRQKCQAFLELVESR